MRAIQADRLDSLDDCTDVEVEQPGPGPGELRIKVADIGIGYVDALLALGRYQVKPTLPHITGADATDTCCQLNVKGSRLDRRAGKPPGGRGVTDR